ncbi:uncharacterized protein LOC112159372 isoform X1 [Oryzias melastigma]|uniref:uncharacterized protein LOC112159372 isoform X1 n=1 Tax=Oryzias melastigma TaxID=30732 RepID=UPI00168D8AB2|nr:uncharacterized protein LOC112159372 isoform X1 [Oryzias melastigma]
MKWDLISFSFLLGHRAGLVTKVTHKAKKFRDGAQVTTGVDPPPQESKRTFLSSATLQAPSMHHRSNKQYGEMVRLARVPVSPKDLYVAPLTGNQQYGWMVSDSPQPWTQIKRFPRRNSEISKFVEQMLMTDRMFSPF